MNDLQSHTTLNAKALAILGAILRAAHEGRRPPSYRELAQLAGIASPNGVMYHLKRLKRLGLVSTGKKKSRYTLRPTCRVLVWEERK